MDESKNLKQILDKISPPKPSPGFEERLIQNWQQWLEHPKPVDNVNAQVLVLTKNYPKMAIAIASLLVVAAIVISRPLWQKQDESLNRVDVLSELSLSTL